MHIFSEEIDAINGQLEAITSKAESENRDLTGLETIKCETLLKQLEVEVANSQSAGRKTSAGATRPGGVPLFRDQTTGQPVHAYKGTAPIDPRNDAPVGEFFRSLLLNDTTSLGDDLKAAATVGSDSGGGYLLTPAISSRVVDLARSASVCMRAGCQTIPMAGSELVLARVTSDPTTQWRGETQTTTASSVGFGRYVLRPKMLACLIPISLELIEDSANAASLIEQTMRNKMAQQLDYAILNGSGSSNQPLGILNTTGINAQTSIGAVSDYSHVTTAVRDILVANYAGAVSELGWIMPPAVGAVYDGLVTGMVTDNTPLMPTPWAGALQRYFTTNLEASGSPQVYSSLIGAFSEVLVGMRSNGIVVDVLDAGQVTDSDSETYNAVSDFMRFIRCRIRVDVLTMQPGFFSAMTGISG